MDRKQKDEYYSSKIGLWYTVWWQSKMSDIYPQYKKSAAHWDEWTRIVPVRGEYSSGDPAVIKEHLELFEKYGLDFILLDDTNGHGADYGSVAQNMERIFETVRSVGSKVSVAVALGGMFNFPENETTISARTKEADIIYENFAKKFDDVYFMWKGRPLLVSYGTSHYFRWDDNRFTVRHATGSVNEGLVSGYVPSTGLWGWVFNNQTDNEEVFGVVPGFNKGEIQGYAPNELMDQIRRENGQRYMKNWLDAIKADREVIMITSWNDFAEEPAIEAAIPKSDELIDEAVKDKGYPMKTRHERDKLNGSDRHNIWLDHYGELAPFWYEEITWAYMALKKGLINGFYYREESSEKFYRYMDGKLTEGDELPHLRPVIIIPDGYFHWFTTKKKGKE